MHESGSDKRLLARIVRTIEFRRLRLGVLGAIVSVACSSPGMDLNAVDAAVETQEIVERDTKDPIQEDELGALLHAADEFTPWNVSCEEAGHCVFERKVPVRDARPDDLLILQVDLDSRVRPDLLVISAPNRTEASAGIKLGFLTGMVDDVPDVSSVSSFPLRCFEVGCGTALPLATELEDGSQISDHLSSSHMLWVVFRLDGEPTRTMVVLEPLREALDKEGRGESLNR